MNQTHAWCSASVVALLLGVACTTTTSTPTPAGSTSDSAVAVMDAALAVEEDAAVPVEDAAAPVPFALTSAEIGAGASFPAVHTCNGANTSPSFSWTPGPESTLSYALVLNDTDISFLHSVTYDIPADVLALPAKMAATYAPSVPAGAHQTKNYGGSSYGYIGPCPPSGEHVYEFTLYALNVAVLPGFDKNTTLRSAVAAVKGSAIASTTLRAKYKQP